ncbi:MAG: CoA pyrophosphatase [Firmicutes bacterium]|nr:CoA pyrophosphatase [Bacillota bacterium]
MTDRLEKLKGRTPRVLLQESCKRSAVIIPLIKTDSGTEVLFEVRSPGVGRQPGDVCFPGGARQNNESPVQTAVREACEELLIKPEQLEIIGPSDMFHNESLLVCPFAAWLKDYSGTFSKDEVSEVFTVPLQHFIDNEPFMCRSRMVRERDEDFPYELISGGKDYKWPPRIDDELFYRLEGHTLWGITARILNGFIKLL